MAPINVFCGGDGYGDGGGDVSVGYVLLDLFVQLCVYLISMLWSWSVVEDDVTDHAVSLGFCTLPQSIRMRGTHIFKTNTPITARVQYAPKGGDQVHLCNRYDKSTL